MYKISAMSENFKKLEAYNFWYGNQPDLGYKRVDYLNKIKDYCQNKLIKVIVGQRRIGKSYLLRQIAFDLIENGIPATNILYINKEYIDFDFIKNYQELDELIKEYKSTLKPEGKVYIFIDEIQNIAQWERLINSYAQHFMDSYEFFISGSNSKMLSGELASVLSGRYISFEIFTFSFREYLGILGLDNTKQNYLNYMQHGGLPELFNLPNEETKRHYVQSVKDTVLLRDIIQRYAIKDPKLLEDLFIYVINNASTLLSISNIVQYLKAQNRKTSYDTIALYLGYIEETFMIHKAQRYEIKGKELLNGNVKYYINDLAYRNFLYSGFAYGYGFQLENLVYLTLKRHGYDLYVGIVPNKEVDFVAKRGNNTLYVQCSYVMTEPTTIEREYASLEAIKDHYPKIVVSMDDIALPNKGGIEHILAWNLDAYLAQ